MATPSVTQVEDLIRSALQWLASQARPDDHGVHWVTQYGLGPEDSLYAGGAGVLVTLLEAHHDLGDDRWADFAASTAASLVSRLTQQTNHSLYVGTVGITFALDAAGRRLGDDSLRSAARAGLRVVRDAFDGERWGDAYDLIGGNAGIALGALGLDDVDLALLAVTPFLTTYETTRHGVTWENRRGQPARRHHISHGTLGFAHALVATAAATGREDLHELGLRAVADVVARNEGAADAFLVPHSTPLQVHDRIERYSYGWCHGPTGDAQTFRLLHRVTGDDGWAALADRCWRTVVSSGLPRRVQPGFWDNVGRCCGTAGVLALALDREVEAGDGQAFADVLVADLAEHATVDRSGARWSNVEFRDPEPVLPPQVGWGQGSAGVIRELLRHARVASGRDPGYAVSWPDQPAAV